MDNLKTGKFISERRKALGYNQKELAEKLNITDKAVSKWETGRSAPDVSLLIPLAGILQVSVAEILNGEKICEEKVTDISDEIIVKFLKKSKSKIILIIILVLALLLGVLVSYPAYQYVNSIAANDYYSIASIVKNKLGCKSAFQQSPAKIEIKSDYTAYLYKDNEKAYMIFFQENKLFSSRMDFAGGTSADLSELGLYSLGWKGESINIFFGADIQEEKYEFLFDGVNHTVTLDDNDFIDFYITKDNAYRHPTDFELVKQE